MDSDTKQDGWRYRLGLFMFFGALPVPVIAPFVIPLLGLPTTETAALIGGVLVVAELLLVGSVPLLGKEGFQALKATVFGWLKLPDGPVSRRRHRFGVTLLIGSLVLDVALNLGIVLSAFVVTNAEDPTLDFLGLDFDQQLTVYVLIEIAVSIGVVVSLFVLGAGFWEKLKAAFEWQSGDAATVS